MGLAVAAVLVAGATVDWSSLDVDDDDVGAELEVIEEDAEDVTELAEVEVEALGDEVEDGILCRGSKSLYPTAKPVAPSHSRRSKLRVRCILTEADRQRPRQWKGKDLVNGRYHGVDMMLVDGKNQEGTWQKPDRSKKEAWSFAHQHRQCRD